MEYRRVLAVGDIHGAYDKLVRLKDRIDFDPSGDLLVFIGDYIDRGNEPIKCLEYVKDLQEKYPDNVVALKGNHEQFMLDFYRHHDIGLSWIASGGYITIKQMRGLSKEKRDILLDWVEQLPLSYSYKEFFFAHAGIEPTKSLQDQNQNDLLWIRYPFIYGYKGDKGIIVSGHTQVASIYLDDDNREDKFQPLFLENSIILCDTSAYREEGRLTCINVLTNEYWQIQ